MTPSEPLQFERTYVTTSDFPTKFTRAYFRYIYSRPARIVPLVVIFLALAVIVVTSSFGSSPLMVPLLWLGIVIALAIVTYVLSVRRVRARIPAGSTFGIGFRMSTFVMRSPQVTSEVAYSLYKSCERRGNFVVLRQRVSRVASFLPAEIFTDESYEFLRAKISAAASGS